jgi:hypothetical protein
MPKQTVTGTAGAAERLAKCRSWWARQHQGPDTITRQQKRAAARAEYKRELAKAKRVDRLGARWAARFKANV